MKHFLLFLFFIVTPRFVCAQFPAACDADKSCLGRAYTSTVTQGKGAHYVDVDNTASLRAIRDGMTVEMWMKPTKQTGSRQFLAGLWGPGRDDNDVWVLYISPNDEIVFEVSNDATKLGTNDNTIVRYSFPAMYGTWSHVAAIFDGSTQTASLVINGSLVASNRNATYPISFLRRPDNATLLTQIGSCNGRTDDASYRSFLGQFDEIKIWSRALSPNGFVCSRDTALLGNESGLVLYYRCNDAASSVTLCDATGNGNTGRMRSGASCQNSDRSIAQTLVLDTRLVSDTVRCVNSSTFTVTLLDTGACAKPISLRMSGRDANQFTIQPPRNFVLQPGVPTTITITATFTKIGDITADFEVNPINSCSRLNAPRTQFRLQRMTELRYNYTTVRFDTLYVGCKEVPYFDSTLRIRNQSENITAPGRLVTVQNVFVTSNIIQIIPPSGGFPRQLQPGEELPIKFRFVGADTTARYTDTIFVISDDQCPGAMVQKIIVSGTVQEVIRIGNTGGTAKIDSMNFGMLCPGLVSDGIEYIWRNLTSRNITVDTIITPRGYLSKRLRFPITLTPNTGYSPNFFRFAPTTPGNYNDSVIFRVTLGNCKIEKVVKLRGRAYDTKVEFLSPLEDWGQVVVGQQVTRNITLRNNGVDTLDIGFTLDGGLVFIRGGSSVRIFPSQTVTIPVTFRPIKDTIYTDKLRLIEQRCYAIDTISVRGEGIIQAFTFEPNVLQILNVPACDSAESVFTIRNTSSTVQVLTNFSITNNAAGKFRLIAPNSFPASVTLQPNEIYQIRLRYVPNDITQDRADRIFLNYQTSPSGTPISWIGQILGTSQTPKIYITPLTVFGTIEAGTTVRKKLKIENISQLPIVLKSLMIPAPFRFIGTPINNLAMNPRDTLEIEVEFAPTTDGTFSGQIIASSDVPCAIAENGTLQGKSIVYRLEAALSIINFGFTSPCEYVTRLLPLVNQSASFPMTVDSIWIDGAGITGATPQFFAWKSQFYDSSAGKISIPPSKIDSLQLTFRPRTPSEPRFVDNSARVHLIARGSGWGPDTISTLLSGKRALTFQPLPTTNTFSDTPVDTALTPRFVRVSIPNSSLNPGQFPITIDSVTFEPDERVFSVTDSLNRSFPIIITEDSTLSLRVRFRPRAPRLYQARMILHTSKPCQDKDTTILVQGTGFATPYYLKFLFGPPGGDTTRARIDTVSITVCDTAEIPVYATREIPATVVDMDFRLNFDTSLVSLAGIRSPLLLDTCYKNFTKSVTTASYPLGVGIRAQLKNFCGIDSAKPLMYLRFVPKVRTRANVSLSIDSVTFDTQDRILYRILAGSSDAFISILKPEISTVEKFIRFRDSVRILECVDTTITIINTGDVAVQLLEYISLPENVILVASSIPFADTLQVASSATVTVRFCPRKEVNFDTISFARALRSCEWTDSTRLAGKGYAPIFPVTFELQNIQSQIGDTVTTILSVKDNISATYNSTTYFMRNLRFSTEILYNKFQLKYISSTLDSLAPKNSVLSLKQSQPGILQLDFSNIDSVLRGSLARITWVALVPDKATDTMFTFSHSFATDSLEFLKLQTVTSSSLVTLTEKCSLTTLDVVPIFSGGFLKVRPQPIDNQGIIEVYGDYSGEVSLQIFTATGERVAWFHTTISPRPQSPESSQLPTVLTSSPSISEETSITPRVEFAFDTTSLQNGVYIIRFVTPSGKLLQAQCLILK